MKGDEGQGKAMKSEEKRGKVMKGRRKTGSLKLSFGAGFLCLVVALGACGRTGGGQAQEAGGQEFQEETGSPQENPWVKDGWGFVPVEYQAAGDVSAYRSTYITRDFIYYSLLWEDGEYYFYRQEIASGTAKRLSVKLPQLAEGIRYTAPQLWADPLGNLILLLCRVGEDAQEREYSLVKYSEDGELLFEKDVTNLLKRQGESISCLETDGEGRIYLRFRNLVRLLDAEGQDQGQVEMEEGELLCRGADGAVYDCQFDRKTGGSKLVRIDFDKRTLGEGFGGLPDNVKYLIPGEGISEEAAGSGEGTCQEGEEVSGGEADFYYCAGTGLYAYRLEEQASFPVTDLLEAGVWGSLEGICDMGDGSFFLLVYDQDQGESGFLRLTFAELGSIPLKEKIVLGVIGQSDNVRNDVVKFNRQNDCYEVEIRSYAAENNSYSEALNQLNMEIISGEGPDLIDLSGLAVPVRKYVSLGLLEDLSPYLERSEKLGKEDFLPNVVEAYTIGGCLVGLPQTFTVNLLIGLRSVVGEDHGISVDEMLEIMDAHPDALTLCKSSYDGYSQKFSRLWLLNILLECNQKFFLDYENGTCSFDSEEFRRLVELVEKLKVSGEGEEDVSWLAQGKALFGFLEGGYAQGFSRNVQVAGGGGGMAGKVMTLGYPTLDGSCAYVLSGAGSVYSILSASAKKEGAWEFMEYMLSQEYNIRTSHAYPVKTEELKGRLEQEKYNIYEKDRSTGQPILDENGNPKRQERGHDEAGNVTNYYPGREELTMLWDVLTGACVNTSFQEGNEVLKIVEEEIQPYFAGDKTLDEAIDVIQSRAQLYISELN